VLEEWFSRYPTDAKSEFVSRFRSTSNWQHQAALFELFLHELVSCMRCTVTLHPQLNGMVTTRPDFLIESPDLSRSYLEAVLATDESSGERGANTRKRVVYDLLDKLESPDFFLGVDEVGKPRTPPSVRKLKSSLEEWLNGLAVEEIHTLAQDGNWSALPRFPYEHDGWTLSFFPIPKGTKNRNRTETASRAIGMRSHEPQIVESGVATRDAIRAKAGRYGKLTAPYVIAVNAVSEEVSTEEIRRTHVMEALFGKQQYVFRRGGPLEGEWSRRSDGVWTSKNGPRYRGLSAVLVAAPLNHWNLANAPVCLYHNPWATKPYQLELTRLPQAIPQADENIKWVQGTATGEILGLPPNWPHC
jgi:hypothetical protein